jgi:hypothetical protein
MNVFLAFNDSQGVAALRKFFWLFEIDKVLSLINMDIEMQSNGKIEDE